MAPKLRVLMLVLRNPDRSPGQRYRLEQFLPHLEVGGIDLTYSWVLDDFDAETFCGRTSLAAKAGVALKASARRLLSLRHLVPAPDVVFVYREAMFIGGPWSEWLASLRAPVIFDFDDAIWIHAISDANRRFAFLKNVGKIPRIVRLAHTVIAGNDYLANWARPHNANVHVIPTCVDTDRWKPGKPKPSDQPVTIGWSGSASTVAHLRLALPALERVKARFGDRVRFRVMGDATFRHEPLGLVGEAWRPDAEIPFLQDLDIGLMPLPDDEWSKGKCGLKALTSMACGAAIVMSPVGVNPEIAQDGVSGFLPRTEDDWVGALSRLIEEPELRRRVALAGRRRVVDAYSVARWKEPLVELIKAAAR